MFKPKITIICGDLLHGQGHNIPNQLQWFIQKLADFNSTFVIVKGNHDPIDLKIENEAWDICNSFSMGGILFSHYPQETGPYIAGHSHPGVRIKQGRFIKCFKAFAVDDHGIICPSYGHYTGSFAKDLDQKTLYYIENATVKRLN